MFENPFKSKPKQEVAQKTVTEKTQEFVLGKLDDMQPVLGKIESLLNKAGENFENLKLSPELASRAKILLPAFIGLLSVIGTAEDAQGQERDRYGLIRKTGQVQTQSGSQQTIQMTEQEWIAEQKRQKDLKTAQNLKTAGSVSMVVGTVLQGVGMTVQDPKAQNALLISGAVLNVAGTGMVVGGNIKAGQAGGSPQGSGSVGNWNSHGARGL